MDVWLLSSISLPTSDKSRNMPHHSLGTLQQGFCIAPASESFLQDLHLRARWHLLLLINSVKQSYDLRVVALPHRLDTYDISEGMVDKGNHMNFTIVWEMFFVEDSRTQSLWVTYQSLVLNGAASSPPVLNEPVSLSYCHPPLLRLIVVSCFINLMWWYVWTYHSYFFSIGFIDVLAYARWIGVLEKLIVGIPIYVRDDPMEK